MNPDIRSILPSVFLLTLLAAVAALLTLTRRRTGFHALSLHAAFKVYLVGLAIQCVHFPEELLTGFHRLLPQLFGLPPMPLGFSVGFNVGWIGIWGLSAFGLRAGVGIALFPVWFLALGLAANGVAHPVLSLLQGDYFPGLATSPFAGIFGVILLARLRVMTGEPVRGDSQNQLSSKGALS
jgi:hypothetical protein